MLYAINLKIVTSKKNRNYICSIIEHYICSFIERYNFFKKLKLQNNLSQLCLLMMLYN
jgi:hypothetical protein